MLRNVEVFPGDLRIIDPFKIFQRLDSNTRCGNGGFQFVGNVADEIIFDFHQSLTRANASVHKGKRGNRKQRKKSRE